MSNLLANTALMLCVRALCQTNQPQPVVTLLACDCVLCCSLNLRSNEIEDDGLAAIAEALQGDHPLERIQLWVRTWGEGEGGGAMLHITHSLFRDTHRATTLGRSHELHSCACSSTSTWLASSMHSVLEALAH